MAFDLQAWKESFGSKLGGWWSRAKEAGGKSIHAFLSATALWPLIDAARKGEYLQAMTALGGLLTGSMAKAGNEITEAIERQKSQPVGADETALASWLADTARRDAELRDALDLILEKLEAIRQVRASLSEPDRRDFDDALRKELAGTGRLGRFEASLRGSGAIAQAGGVAAGAGGVAIGGDVRGGTIITGHRNVVGGRPDVGRTGEEESDE